MVTEDVRLVRQFAESLAAGDRDGALGCFHPEAQWDWTESISPFRGVYVGHEGLQRFLAETQETWEDFAPHIDEVIHCGEGRLLTRTTVSGRARASGIEMEAHGVVLWTVRDGRIVQAKLFQTVEDGLTATGRSQ